MIPAPILVLIVNYRTAALTAQAIAAIAAEVKTRGDAHILVVDNGSGDGSAAAIAAAIGELEASDFCSLLALETNAGFAAGNNAGLDHYRRVATAAGADPTPGHVWLLNPDTIAEPGALGALVDFLAERPEAGLVGGRCLHPDGTPRFSAFRFHSPLGEFVTSLDFGPLRRLMGRHDVVMPIADHPFRAEWLSGSHLMIRGAVLERIGQLDPSYFLYFEETDYCARAAAAGFEIWHVPASRVVHIGGQATGFTEARPTKRRPRYWFASRARFFLRRHGVAATHLANLLWLLGAPPGALLARLRGRPRLDPPRLWRDFLSHYYGPGGLMYRTRDLAASEGRLPDFVIIGAMKAATSSLHAQLAAQPGIFMTSPKEPNFFSDDHQWARGLDWYRGLCAAAPPGALCGEASTHYTKLPTLPDALPRLRATLPGARLIYLMRHPVDRLVSHYIHGWLDRSIDGPIDAAIDHYPELVDYGRYAMQIAPWLDAFGPETILPVFMERLIAAPQAELERICAFLGYSGTPVWDEAIGPQNVSGYRLRDSLWRDGIVYNPLVSSLRRTLVPRAVRNRIKSAWQMRERPQIGAAALARITALYDDDLRRLGTMLGTSLDCDNFRKVVSEKPLDWA